ncbi:MAG: acyl carrier protein [Nitrososphaerota archaeon]|nr:acyl carrier protein [Nitrososphaerota archaeon]
MNIDGVQIISDLKKILVEDLFVDIPLEDIKENDSFTIDIGLDSVGLIELVTIVQDKYDLHINVEQDVSDHFRNLQSLSKFIESRISRK